MKIKEVLVLIWSLSFLYAQKPFEGSITYSVKIDAKQDLGPMASQMPSTVKVFYRGGKARMDAGPMVVIADNDAKKSYLLFPEQASYVVSSTEVKDTLSDKIKYEVKATGEKTKMLGHPVEKYIIEIYQQDSRVAWTESWVALDLKAIGTDALKSPLFSGVKGLPGIPLWIKSELMGMNAHIIYAATQISTNVPDERLFQVPEHYQEMKLGLPFRD
ncbi:MAG: hypothetical protein NZ580_06570 [Bacteroidia bacterium]|nr:hypothetical protein [Bacteroidia bacterium]MDW8235171.1 hypothetical protein [Bacteroidia bacterium]